MAQPWCIDHGVDGFRSSMVFAMLWRRSSGQFSGVRTPTCNWEPRSPGQPLSVALRM